jgi:echinoderm microtubule-associated protein-like 6
MHTNDSSCVQRMLVYGHAASLHAAAWHPVCTSLFATACEAHRVFVFDASSCELVKTGPLPCAARACAWSPIPLNRHSHHLCIGGVNGKLVLLDEEKLKPVWDAHDCQHGISDLKYSPSGHALAAAGMDRHIHIYKTGSSQYTRVACCRGHSSVVRHMDWSSDGTTIQSMCSAYEVLFWDGCSGKQTTNCQRDTQWSTWTCTLGFPVMGIWSAGSNGTDINSVDRNAAGTLVASADDCGLVKLFNFPCVVHDAPHRACIGHAAHVTCVRFSANGTHLVSTGGADRSVFQFSVKQIPQMPPPGPQPERVWGSVDGKVFGWTWAVPSGQEGPAHCGADGTVQQQHRSVSIREDHAESVDQQHLNKRASQKGREEDKRVQVAPQACQTSKTRCEVFRYSTSLVCETSYCTFQLHSLVFCELTLTSFALQKQYYAPEPPGPNEAVLSF